MCTLVVAHQLVPDLPLIVLANRDEFVDRPARGPGLLRSDPPAFGGRDEQAGGTWMAVNEHGLLVGLTNLAGQAPDLSRRSRGLLVVDLLEHRTAAEVRDALLLLGRDEYNPFRVIASDGEAALRARYDGTAAIEMLGPGVHGATNWRDNSEGAGKRLHAEQLVADALSGSPRDSLSTARALVGVAKLHDADGDPRQSLCCHAPGYGTRSSSIVVLGSGSAEWLHAEGPPCRTEHEDHGPAFRALLRRR